MREEPIINEQGLLDEVVDGISEIEQIAIDTEFVRESTYFPQLCLIQIAGERLIACVDCLAPIDLDALFDVLFRKACTWVLHSARQDLEVLSNRSGRLPTRLFDTQVAAALIGYPPQVGLQELLARTIGVELAKGHARADWSRRPLDDAALRYAIDDVRYLLAAKAHLEQRLAELGRTAWLEEDSQRLLEEAGAADLPTIWRRLKGVSRLDAAQQRVALALLEWRESRAKRLNRPRRWIISDELVTRLAQTMPDSPQALRSVELPKRLAAKSGEEILRVIRETDHARLDAQLAAAQPPAADRKLMKGLQLKVKERAEALGLYPEVLATRRELAAIAAGETPALLARGWRAEQLKDALGL